MVIKTKLFFINKRKVFGHIFITLENVILVGYKSVFMRKINEFISKINLLYNEAVPSFLRRHIMRQFPLS